MTASKRTAATGAALIADAIRFAARHLGTGNAATDMGAIEAHSVKLAASIDAHAAAVSDVATAIDRVADALDRIASAAENES